MNDSELQSKLDELKAELVSFQSTPMAAAPGFDPTILIEVIVNIVNIVRPGLGPIVQKVLTIIFDLIKA